MAGQSIDAKNKRFLVYMFVFFFFWGGGGAGGEEGGAGGEGNQSVNAQKYRNTLKHSAFVYSFRLLQ